MKPFCLISLLAISALHAEANFSTLATTIVNPITLPKVVLTCGLGALGAFAVYEAKIFMRVLNGLQNGGDATLQQRQADQQRGGWALNNLFRVIPGAALFMLMHYYQ